MLVRSIIQTEKLIFICLGIYIYICACTHTQQELKRKGHELKDSGCTGRFTLENLEGRKGRGREKWLEYIIFSKNKNVYI